MASHVSSYELSASEQCYTSHHYRQGEATTEAVSMHTQYLGTASVVSSDWSVWYKPDILAILGAKTRYTPRIASISYT